MSAALEAVAALRTRREARNRRNAGLGFRYGDAFTSPAEEAALRLAQADADRALVAAELAKQDEEEARFAEQQALAVPRLEAADAAYRTAHEDVFLALQGGFITGTVEAGQTTAQVRVTGLLEALERAAALRHDYETAFALADKFDALPEDYVRLPSMQLAGFIHAVSALAVRA